MKIAGIEREDSFEFTVACEQCGGFIKTKLNTEETRKGLLVKEWISGIILGCCDDPECRRKDKRRAWKAAGSPKSMTWLQHSNPYVK